MTFDPRPDPAPHDPAPAAVGPPGLWARHGNKVLIALTVACLAFAAVRYKGGQDARRADEGRQALANAWAGVGELRQRVANAAPDLAAVRGPLETDINSAVGQVTENPQATPVQAAWALLARGEMYWTLAHAADASPAATTGPASRPATGPASGPAVAPQGDPLTLAATAYASVVERYASVRGPATIARFALAAVAEERRDVAAARTQYTAIIETPDVSTTDHAMATARLSRLGRIERPTLLLPASRPAATLPAGVDLMQSLGLPPSPGGPPQAGPTTSPASSPAAAPATGPAGTRPSP